MRKNSIIGILVIIIIALIYFWPQTLRYDWIITDLETGATYHSDALPLPDDIYSIRFRDIHSDQIIRLKKYKIQRISQNGSHDRKRDN